MELIKNVEFNTANVRPTPARRKQPTPPITPLKRKPDEKCAGQAREEQKGVVFVLPDGHGIVCNSRRIFWVGVSIGDKEPSTVAMPEAVLRIVGIFLFVTVRVMTQMISGPLNGGVL